MFLQMAKRLLFETDKRLLWKLAWNFGWKGMLSVEAHKRRLKRGQYFPPQFTIVGVGRRDKDDDAFRSDVRKDLARFGHENPADDCWNEMASHLFYLRADFAGAGGLQDLAARLQQLEARAGLPGNRLFYFSVDPDYFAPLVEKLSAAGLIQRDKRVEIGVRLGARQGGCGQRLARDFCRADIGRGLIQRQLVEIGWSHATPPFTG